MSLLYWFREEEADYVASIQILKSENPLPLPAIKPLKARVETEADRAARRQRQAERVSRFLERAKSKERHLGAVAG